MVDAVKGLSEIMPELVLDCGLDCDLIIRIAITNNPCTGKYFDESECCCTVNFRSEEDCDVCSNMQVKLCNIFKNFNGSNSDFIAIVHAMYNMCWTAMDTERFKYFNP